jgi:hypothetical protein
MLVLAVWLVQAGRIRRRRSLWCLPMFDTLPIALETIRARTGRG